MVKRKKWKSKEDQLLKIIIKNMKKPLKWDVISHLLKKQGIKKSSKQCRERWMH